MVRPEHMYLIVAISDNGVIGVKNKLPWTIPHDLAWFKMHTINSVIIMGRKTWDSLPRKPLSGRVHIILSREHMHSERNLYWCNSMKEAIQIANQFDKRTFIIGGADIFHQALLSKHVTHAIITRVHTTIANPHAITMQLPPMTTLWSSKPFRHQTLEYHFEMARIHKSLGPQYP